MMGWVTLKEAEEIGVHYLSAVWGHREMVASTSQEEGTHQESKRRHLDVGFPASRTVRNTFLMVKPPSLRILLWQPELIKDSLLRLSAQ